MAFDYKKEYKEFYLPPKKPHIVTIPSMNFVSVNGSGNPNTENGAFQQAVSLLYGVAFTVKMSYKTDRRIDGYFEFVVPPLEGLWYMNSKDGTAMNGIDYGHKENFVWNIMIRLPEFVTPSVFKDVIAEVSRKKKTDYSVASFFTYNEGTCVQCMHIGPYDDEPATIESMHRYAESEGYNITITDDRLHHEIYLSDARRCNPAKQKTVIRLPVTAKK